MWKAGKVGDPGTRYAGQQLLSPGDITVGLPNGILAKHCDYL